MSKQIFLLCLSFVTIFVSTFLTCNLALDVLSNVHVAIAIAIAIAYEASKYAIAIGWCGFENNALATVLFLFSLICGSVGATSYAIYTSMEEDQRQQFEAYQRSSQEVQSLQVQLQFIEKQMDTRIVTADLQLENARKLQKVNQLTKSSSLLQQQELARQDLLQQHAEISRRLQEALDVPHETFWMENRTIAIMLILFVSVVLEFNSIFALKAFANAFDEPSFSDSHPKRLKSKQSPNKSKPDKSKEAKPIQEPPPNDLNETSIVRQAILSQRIPPTIKDVMQEFNLSQRKARQALQCMIDDNLLSVSGKRFILNN